VSEWLLRNRTGIYAILNAFVALSATVGSGITDVPFGVVAYVCALLAVCSSPLLLLRRINDRYALLAIFMAAYFVMFGALDLQCIFTGANPELDVTPARIGVFLGAVLTVGGYLFSVRMIGPPKPTSVTSDWSNGAVLLVGLGCWGVGSAAMAFYSLFAVTENSVQATSRGFENMGPLLTFAVMLGQLVQPVGLVVLGFGLARNQTRFWSMLVIAVVVLQAILGFVSDSKGTALFGFLLVALTKVLWEGKLPKGWLASIVVFAVFLFPVFQAAREVARVEKGLNRHQVLLNFGAILEKSLESKDKLYEGRQGQRPPTFLERSSSEGNLELVFSRVGVDTPFLNGMTLIALPLAFVPRLILPDKEDVSVGQLFNRTFFHGSSDDFTYISVSELGELYWNFGWTGVIVGMLLTGIILGVVGAKCDLADAPSLTRLLISMITIKTLCFAFGGSIALAYIVWLRGLAAVGLLHLMFSRRTPVKERNAVALRAISPEGAVMLPVPRFTNILR
jgi:O-antigen polysaccharide polymerase Wzy